MFAKSLSRSLFPHKNRRRNRRNRLQRSNLRFEQLEPRTVLSASGWLATATSIGGVGVNDVATDSTGNIYAAGGFEETADFAPGASIPGDTLTSTGSFDSVVVKYAADGSMLWATQIAPQHAANAVAVDGSANSYVGGSQSLAKVDTNGSVEWLHNITGGYSFMEDVAVDSSGVVAVGHHNDTIEVGQTPAGDTVTLAGSGAYMVKYNADGEVLWTRQDDGDSLANEANGVTIDSNGDVYVTGMYSKDGTGKGKNKVPGTQGYDIAVWKFDGSSGNKIWTQLVGGEGSDSGEALYVDGSDLYLTGAVGDSASPIDFGNDSVVVPDVPSFPSYGYVAKLDAATGDFQWATGFGGPTGWVNGQVGRSLDMDSSGTLYLGGGLYPDGGAFGPFELGESDLENVNFLATVNPATGEFLSAQRIAGQGWDPLSVDPNDNLVYGGWFQGTDFEFPTGDVVSSTPDANGDPSDDLFVLKLEAGAPNVVALSASPDPVVQGSDVSLSADGVLDVGGAVASVAFYHDSDGDGILDTAVDQLLATDTDVSDAWGANVSTASLALGTHTVFAQATDSDGLTSDAVAATVEVVDAPVGIELNIYDIRFDSRRGGKDWRAVVEIRDVDGNAVEGVSLKVDFAGTTYTLTTDSNGIAHTDWERKLASGDYYANAYDLALADYFWDPFSFPFEDDSDGDGWADDLLQV